MRLLPAVLLVLLGACGVDGPPVPPSEVEEEARRSGVTVTGSAEIGVSGRL
ncbi:hypothetical protein [Jannaschia formosa]|uniref:hypothetical protein n=1 Tax=Jannaschia formosa TaxID=2259592 RepID=UPI00143172EC|nr:hypothetical protein [Jannaschia formosa]